MKAVELRDVFRVHRTPWGDAAALQGLTLDVDEGETVVVLGPSGSGKSTLLRVLAALEPPSAGVARVLGLDVGHLSGRAAADFRASKLGFVDQHYQRALPPDLSVAEIVTLQLALRGAPRRERLERGAELLAAVGLPEAGDRRPAQLSGGEQQRVALCAALAHRPGLLLADEPTGELDAANAGEVFGLIRQMAADQGTTVIVVSHDPGSTRIADRVVHVRDGRISEEVVDGRSGLVVGRGGWVHVPAALLEQAGVGSRVVGTATAQGVLLQSLGGNGATPDPQPQEPAAPVAEPGAVAAELVGVRKAFGSRIVFDGIDAGFRRGQVTVVAGRSGSGKSTMLFMLAGLERPDAGAVLVAGQPLSPLDRAQLADLRRAQVGVVGQDPGLVAFLTARENVAMALTVRGVDPEQAAAIAGERLASVGLAERAGQLVSRLSAGERQRVAIARAVAPGPQLLLVDEPTSRLDEVSARGVAALLRREAHEGGLAVVCATHDPVVLEQADEAIALG